MTGHHSPTIAFTNHGGDKTSTFQCRVHSFPRWQDLVILGQGSFTAALRTSSGWLRFSLSPHAACWYRGLLAVDAITEGLDTVYLRAFFDSQGHLAKLEVWLVRPDISPSDSLCGWLGQLQTMV